MKISGDFFLKHRLAVMRLSRDLLSTKLDEQLKTVDYYEEALSVSRGTVQKAMQFLIEQRCIETQFRGHLGTYLLMKDEKKLWEFSGFGVLSGSMPLPLNNLSAGLATGICDCMKLSKTPFNFVFVQGSRTRMNGLQLGKYDFIVASRLTESVLRKSFEDIECVMELPGCTYGGRYVLLFADPKQKTVEDGMTIAVDPTSVDQFYLTQELCKGKKRIRYFETTYVDTRYSVKRGEADVTVSRLDVLEYFEMGSEHVKELNIPGFTKKEVDAFTNSMILARKDNYGLKEILQQVLRPTVISNAQRKVMTNLRVPSYY